MACFFPFFATHPPPALRTPNLPHYLVNYSHHLGGGFRGRAEAIQLQIITNEIHLLGEISFGTPFLNISLLLLCFGLQMFVFDND